MTVEAELQLCEKPGRKKRNTKRTKVTAVQIIQDAAERTTVHTTLHTRGQYSPHSTISPL